VVGHVGFLLACDGAARHVRPLMGSLSGQVFNNCTSSTRKIGGRERGEEGVVMVGESIQAELRRLQLHPVNLHVVSEIDGNVVLQGSLLRSWQVPQSIDGQWFLKMLTRLPDSAGPKAMMDAFYEAYTAEGVANV
jgi:hypothetical protein